MVTRENQLYQLNMSNMSADLLVATELQQFYSFLEVSVCILTWNKKVNKNKRINIIINIHKTRHNSLIDPEHRNNKNNLFIVVRRFSDLPLLNTQSWLKVQPSVWPQEKRQKEKTVTKLLPQHWIKPSGEGGGTNHLIKQHGGNERSKGSIFIRKKPEERKGGDEQRECRWDKLCTYVCGGG